MTNPHDPHSEAYKSAGVDTAKGDALADWLAAGDKKPFIHPRGLGQLSAGIGGFAGVFDIDFKGLSKPQLVASTDGVGTKLLLAIEEDTTDGLGQDLVAMCVNDLYTVGAVPLFFLDYYATGQLSEDQFKKVLTGIKKSCQICSMALMGGETAEMPGLYGRGHFDLAGFVVGVVDDSKRLGAHRTQEGDVLVSLQSTGFHANGFSLIRTWLTKNPQLRTTELMHHLLTPTRLYPEVIALADKFKDAFHALANITGGGISGNLPRVIADNLQADILFSKIPTEQWMTDFINHAGSTPKEVEPVFNLGIGMIAVVGREVADTFVQAATDAKLGPKIIGELTATKGPASVVYH